MTATRVLVVDDDPLFRRLLTSMLRKDFEVETSSDGAEGYYRALERPMGLAIIDIRMPGWDGLKTVRAFREHQALARVPVMVLTADPSRETIRAAIQAGANDYVIKSTLTREELLRKACRLVNVRPRPVPSASSDPSAAPAEPACPPECLEPAAASGETTALAQDPNALLQSIIDNWD